MAFEIVIPRLGWSMEEGVFVDWLKSPGEFVRRGEPLYELEGEKAIQEVEALEEGFLHLPAGSPQQGTTLPVGAVLGYLLAEGESPPLASAAPQTVVDLPIESAAAEQGARHNQLEGTRTAAQHQSLAPDSDSPSLPEAAFASTISSPRARRVAQELHINWQMLPGTGAGGRVRESDIRQAAARQAIGTSQAPTETRHPVSKRRRVIAQRMSDSHIQTSPVTLMAKVDASNLVNLREQLKQIPSVGALPSYQDIIVKLVSELLPRHPQLMSRWEEEEIEIPGDDQIHIGIAVDTPEGLLVPVLHHPRKLNLPELAERSRKLIEQARVGQLPSHVFDGSVFTITNLGAFGVDFFTPMINLPEASILGLGAIRKEPVVLDDGTISVRQQLSLSLTFDHRRLDGAPAARFLQELSSAITNPSAWLLSQQ